MKTFRWNRSVEYGWDYEYTKQGAEINWGFGVGQPRMIIPAIVPWGNNDRVEKCLHG